MKQVIRRKQGRRGMVPVLLLCCLSVLMTQRVFARWDDPEKPWKKERELHLVGGKQDCLIEEAVIDTWQNRDGSWNEDAVRAYLPEIAGRFQTTDFKTVFTDHSGKRHVFCDDQFQWEMDIDATAKAVCQALEERLESTEVKYTNGLEWNSKDSIGKSYVEVCIDEQTVWWYQNGKLKLKTPCVTGTEGGRDTDKGIYRIFYRQSPAVLTGPDYESPVSFWMPFNRCGEGLHDATWRSEFGGEIYKTNGSHGCVNLPFHSAELMYPELYVGYPVIVY